MSTVQPPHSDAPSDTERISAALEGIPHQWVVARDAMPTVDVSSERVHELLTRLLREARFEVCTLVTAIDRFPEEPRFQMVWQLLSLEHNDRVRVYARLTSDEPVVATCTDLWPGAAFGERECFDMFGIRFSGHADLKRLLMPEGYDHFPLRKDFPQQGIQPDRLYREWDDQRRASWNNGAEGGRA